MKWIQSQTNTVHIFLLVTGITVLSLCNILIFELAIASVFLYTAGALTYSIYLHLQKIDRDSMIDYIQTGEGAFGTIIFFIIASFITSEALPALALAIIILIIAELIYCTISKFNMKDKFLNGLFANIILILCILFLLIKKNILTHLDINFFLLGYGQKLASNNLITILIIIFSIAIYTFYHLFKQKIPEAALISQGAEYFTIPGITHIRARSLLFVIRGFLICITIFLLGWLAGFARYFPSSEYRNNRHADIITILITILIIQTLLMLGVFIEFHYIILSILVGSYIIFGYRTLKGRSLYDRD